MLICMRTTIRLNDTLLKDLKHYAAETHRSLTAVIEDAVRSLLSRCKKDVSRKPVHLPSFKGNGLQPGVDLDHTASLIDLMEEKHDSD